MSDIDGVTRFPIERSHLLFFARSIGDPNADEIDFDTAIAPPTFGIAYLQFRPRYVLRPQPGVPWVGSGRSDSGADATDFEGGLHAEQEFIYHRPIRAGMVLTVETRDGSSWTKARRDNGHLAFSEAFSDFRDEATGELVLTTRLVGVVVRSDPAPHGGPTGPADSTGSAAASADETPVDGLPDEGETRELVVFDGLARSQMVMYSGSSGDYNPIHTDEIFTTRVAGYPSVFAHGMLTMAASGRILTEWVDPLLLRSYSAQFRGQVWPGDTLTVRATVESRTPGSATVSLTTTTQDDRLVMSGRGLFAAER